jgi:hypothetical protein
MNLQKDGALQTNAVRHADAMQEYLFFTIRFNASHIVFRNMPKEDVLGGNK